MKKFYTIFFTLLITGSTAFSQHYLLKSELLPDQPNRDTRFTVLATVMDNDSWCRVTWPDPVESLELAYDDGEADDFFVLSEPGNISANKFHPSSYPCIVTGGRINVGNGSFPGPFLGSSFRVLVYDDDGEGGLPGTALDSMDVKVNNYEWVEFEGMTVTIMDGDFYLAMKQLVPYPYAAPLCVDEDTPTYFISYTHFIVTPGWVPAPLQDFMIRAWTAGYNEPERDIDYFQVARFSGFNPSGSPLLGDTTILQDTSFSSEYDDNAWDTLPAGLYAYGVKTHFTAGEWSEYDVSNIVTHIMNCYMPSCFYQADTGSLPLILCPPLDSTGSVPFNFNGYNLYFEGEFEAFLPFGITSYDPLLLPPVKISCSLTAIYDLGPLGYPGETSESMGLQTEFIRRIGYPVPFLEQWNLGTFETNNWAADGPNWTINGQEGNPDPSAQFTWDPILTGYESSLTSCFLQADSMTEGNIYLDFDIKLHSVVPTGKELLLVQVWNWESQVWATFDTLSNEEGSFDWTSEHLDITSVAMGMIFRVRYTAEGENSINILDWLIDNIHVYRDCPAPTNFSAWPSGQYQGIVLEWDPPGGVQIDEWIEWDDGMFSGTSIGTGGPVEFDAAQRWEPAQLTDYEGASVSEIAFFPNEPTATYRVRVWIGESAQNLVADQLAEFPIPGEWNTVTLTAPVPIDITQELWVGYHVETPTGHPAGVDDGPANDGYGNLMNFGGWQTLLQINPDLDYNWNIKAHIQTLSSQKPGPQSVPEYAIYRSIDEDPFVIIDYCIDNEYIDHSDLCTTSESIVIMYKVSAIYSNGSDTCFSDFTNEDGFMCWPYIEEQDQLNSKVYPNPCHDILKIESSEELGLIYIYNSFGELMQKKKGDEKQLEIPVSAYPAGVYMIRVETEGRVISRKVMVVH